jgi:hypothetical protein
VPQFLSLLPPKYGRFQQQLGKFTFPNGSVCWFGHCARESDVYLYQGNQWAKLLVDEASHMTQFIIGYLSTRVRSPRSDVFLQVLMGSNPGGPGHGFLKRGWVRPEGWEISHLARASRSRSMCGGLERRRTGRAATCRRGNSFPLTSTTTT